MMMTVTAECFSAGAGRGAMRLHDDDRGGHDSAHERSRGVVPRQEASGDRPGSPVRNYGDQWLTPNFPRGPSLSLRFPMLVSTAPRSRPD